MGQNCCSPGPDDNEMVTPPVGNKEASREANVMSKSEVARPAPPSHAQAPTPAPPPAPRLATAAPASNASAGGLTFAMVLTDLEQAELMVYHSAFAGFSGGGNPVTVDNAALRDYVATNSVLNVEDLDVELLKAASSNEEMVITQADFLKLLREHAASESQVLERFLGLSTDGESITSQDCRSGLLLFTTENMGALTTPITEARWDSIFDVVMGDSAPMVPMEGWSNYCKRVARIVRVTHLAKL